MLSPTTAHAGPPSCDAACADRARLIEKTDQARAKADAANAAVVITPALVARSTLDLSPRVTMSVSALNVSRSTFPVETKAVAGDVTLITLVSDLLFPFDSAELTSAARAKIAELTQKIPRDVAVDVDGYTDSLGSDAYDLDLSQRRAEAVAAVIRGQRPDLTLTVTGHGKADPVAPNTTSTGADDPVGRAQNRRVTVSYSG